MPQHYSTCLMPLLKTTQYYTILLNIKVRPMEGAPGQTVFTWLLQCDFGGLLPVSLLNMVMPYCIKLFTASLKKHLKKSKK